MDTFATSIKEKYQERLINREKQWPPCHSNKLVRLELVEREKGEVYSASEQRGRESKGRGTNYESGRDDKDVKRTPLAYGELFKVENGRKPVRKVLVEGDAGIGKTTLFISVSEDWANGKLFQQFELVLLLPLRHKEIAVVDSIPELLKLLHSSKRLCNSVAESLEEMEGKKVLIIADGWDELAESGRLEGSFLYKLVSGEILPFVSLVITSRPSASASLHQLPCIDRFVEVRGFDKQNIIEYIQSEFASDQEKASRLLEQLENNPLVESVCSVPLNCAIVCHLWRTLEEALPTTMTELYTKIILNVILRNITKKDAFKHIDSLPNFDALPKELQQSWALLCKFAFETIVKDQIVFSQEVLADIFPHGLANVLNFGLLQTSKTLLDTGYGTSFHFLHLTFQEYLAALYVVKNISDQVSRSDLPIKQFEHYLSNVGSGRDFVICRFICGIFFDDIEQRYYFSALRPFIPTDNRALCHCAFEAKSEVLFNNIIVKLPKRDPDYYSRHNFSAYSAHDCAAVLYVIVNMQEENNVKINFSNSGVRENQIRALADILARKNGMLQVTELSLSGNKLTNKSVSDLFHRASTSFQSLRKLNLKGNRIGSDSITLLRKSLVTFDQLSYLVLSDCPLGVSGMQALEDAVCIGSLPGLKQLNQAGSLTSDADVNGALLATSLDAIVSYCPNLSHLDLSRNNLGVPGASALARVLCQCKKGSVQQELDSLLLIIDAGSTKSVCNSSIKEIHIDETNLGNEGLIAFVECSCHIGVYKWSLKGNSIHATGISCLANAVCAGKIVLSGTIISSLYLDDNPLGLEGTAAVGRMLSSSHYQLWGISLNGCHLMTPGNEMSSIKHGTSTAVSIIGKQLCHIMIQNNSIKLLNLNGNSFTGEGIHILAGFLHLCPCLQTLRSSLCGISSDDLKQLLDQLTYFKDSSKIPCCSKLEIWKLSNNQIDNSGAIALMDHLPSLFPSLGGVNFSGNHVGNETIKRINEEMTRRREAFQNYKEFQRQWKKIVDVLYKAANDLFCRPYPYLVVVEKIEEEELHFGGSSEKENPIHIEETATEELLCSPVHSEAEGGDGPHYSGGSSEREDETHTYTQTNPEAPSAEILSEQHEDSLSSIPVPISASSMPTICDSIVVEQECYEHSSDDDSETYCTPPTSPTSPNEYNGSLDVATEDSSGNLPQSHLCSSVPELKDLDLIKLVNWQGVGLQLGIEDYELQTIQLNYQHHSDRKREMFRVWLRTCANPNYYDLIKALEAVGERKVAQQIRENFPPSNC